MKHLDCRKLRRSLKSKHKRILAETYRGANVDAMKHHIKPCLTNKPDQVILHVGTNDLSSKNSKGTADGIAEICEIIKRESQNQNCHIANHTKNRQSAIQAGNRKGKQTFKIL